jgi:alkylation response protein AidB-like acyl-CoA dehydrogenase
MLLCCLVTKGVFMSFLAYPATDTQRKLLHIAGELADTFALRATQNDWEGRFPLENYTDLHHAGYLSLTIPQKLGGWGASVLDATLAQYRLAQGDASTGLVTAMHLLHIGKMVEGHTDYPPLLVRICRDVIEHGAMLNTCISEPATGSPSRGGLPTTVAQRQSDGSWCINGRKTFATGSYALHYFVVGCTVDSGIADEQPRRGNFLVHRSQSGVHIEDTWDMLGMRGTGSNDLVLENVQVDAEAFLDESIPSAPNIQTLQSAWGLLVAAVYLGTAQAARDEAIRFARERRPNSLKGSISELPHIQEKAAKMDLALLQARSVLFGVAEQYTNDPTSIHISQFAAAKYLATNHAVEIVDLAMRIVGAASLSLTSPLQRYYRDVRAGLHNPPMDDSTLSMLGKLALGVAGK